MYRLVRLSAQLASAVLFSVLVPAAAAEDNVPLPHADDFTSRLGLTTEEVFTLPDIPQSVFTYRGETPGEDNVVFYYRDSFYLFWFHDRIWQVRADKRWKGELDGVHMGMNLQDVINLWGPPINDRDENPTWTLPDRGYPVRIRLYFSSTGGLEDIYVYRSDW